MCSCGHFFFVNFVMCMRRGTPPTPTLATCTTTLVESKLQRKKRMACSSSRLDDPPQRTDQRCRKRNKRKQTKTADQLGALSRHTLRTRTAWNTQTTHKKKAKQKSQRRMMNERTNESTDGTNSICICVLDFVRAVPAYPCTCTRVSSCSPLTL